MELRDGGGNPRTPLAGDETHEHAESEMARQPAARDMPDPIQRFEDADAGELKSIKAHARRKRRAQ